MIDLLMAPFYLIGYLIMVAIIVGFYVMIGMFIYKHAKNWCGKQGHESDPPITTPM